MCLIKKENAHIEILKEYDFKTLYPNIGVSLFNKLYPSEDRENLQGFLEESRIINYLMKYLSFYRYYYKEYFFKSIEFMPLGTAFRK